MPADQSDLLREALLTIRTLRSKLQEAERAYREPIAIVGMGCRFPGGSDSPEQFWRVLRDGIDTIVRVPANRWPADELYDPSPDAPGKMHVREGGFLQDVESFDPAFFGISPREALRMDPQQRMMLEVSWEALENAGIAPDSLQGSATGIFSGVMNSDHAMRQAHGLGADGFDPHMLAGSELSFIAGRVAHFLGLQGPALATATACSSSLVAVHLACQALRQRQCDLALAGGVNLIADPATSIMLTRLRAISTDGRCRTFDASANGYGRGEGCGVLVLRRLRDAVEAGDRIVALIRGSAVSHDGPSAGLTVPNGLAQEKVIRLALENAGVSPNAVDYVEAHGTGTALGDPIEIRAIAQVFGRRDHPLLVGSVKTNIGHLEAAAGVASIAKVATMLEKKEIPPHLHFNHPSPHIPWKQIPIQIPTERRNWNTSQPSRIAGISSFGISGTNAHLVLEEGPAVPPKPPIADRPLHILSLSAKTLPALKEQIARFSAWFRANPQGDWADICFTANAGRAQFGCRTAIIAGSILEAQRLLDSARLVSLGYSQPETLLAAEGAESAKGLEDWRRLLQARTEAYLGGARVDWLSFETPYLPLRRRIALPTYAFQRERFWALGEQPYHRSIELQNAWGDSQPDIHADDSLPPSEPRSGKEWLSLWLQKSLGMSSPPSDEIPLLNLGVDSLVGQELQNAVWRSWGISIDLGEIIAGASIASLAPQLFCVAAPSQQEGAAATPASDRTRRYALSPGQAALAFIHRSSPQSIAYNVGFAVRLDGKIEIPIFRRTLQILAERHECLRTVFRENDSGELEAEIRSAADVSFHEHNVEGIADDAVSREVHAAYAVPFDLMDGPAWRADLFRESLERHVLLIGMHHILCDAQSCWTLLEEMMRIYAALSDNRPIPLAPLRHSYSEFSAYQRRLIDTPAGEKAKKFWRNQLSGELPVLALPSEKSLVQLPTFTGATERVLVPPALTDALRQLAQEQRATLFTILLAAYQVLLSRWCGQEAVITGVATSVRPPEFEGVVGYFINPVAIRGDLSGNPSFIDFLEKLRVQVLEAIAHRDLPFPMVVEATQRRREANTLPVFQSDFALNRTILAAKKSTPEDSKFGLRLFPLDEEVGQFDLSLHCTEDEDGITAQFKYNIDRLTSQTVRDLATSFIVLLETMVQNPRVGIRQARLLSAEQRRRLLEAGAGRRAASPFKSLGALFQEQARRTPDAIAVEKFDPSRSQREEMSYAELDRRANGLAAKLRDLGCAPEIRVGIHMSRSCSLLVAILGVLKTGAAWVPLDSAYPPDRLDYIAADSAIRVLLVDDAGTNWRPSGDLVTVHISSLDPDGGEAIDPACEPSPDSLAYILYTSGSTGKPKGAMITHAGLANYLHWSVNEYGVHKGCGAPVNTSFGFDATITSIFSPLLTGGRVVLLPEENTIECLAHLLRERKEFSLLKITPAQLEVLGSFLPDESLRGVARALVIGGEALRVDTIERWLRFAPETRVINEYGPTETVVGCTTFEVDPMLGLQSGTVPIGKPIANTHVYILDRDGELAPPGVVGELYIGGAGVARGYVSQPGLTKERFLPDRLAGPDARMYRSGDLARWRSDGELDFLGRADMQVKLRGYRIEPGEIETILCGHSSVRDCAVGIYDGALVAHVVGTAPAAETRAYLRTKLPEYMIPQFFVEMEELPLTANGKIDRKALPAPKPGRTIRQAAAPRDQIEVRLQAIWEDLLKTSPIGIHDDFFALGGHSLLAVRLMAAIRAEFGRELPLASILRETTIAAIGAVLRESRSMPRESALVPIRTRGNRTPIFCVPGAGGNAIYLHNLARALGDHQPFYGIQGRGINGEAEPHTSVEEMAEYYLEAVRKAQAQGPYHLVGHSLGGWVAFEMAYRLEQSGSEVGFLGIIDTPVPAPVDTLGRTVWDNARWIAELTARIAQLLNPALTVHEAEMRGLSSGEQIEYFRRKLIEADVFPEQSGVDELKSTLALFKAHAAVRYQLPQQRVAVPIHMFRTAHAPDHRPELQSVPDWGWSVVGDVSVIRVPGEHLSVLRPPHVERLAEQITCVLDNLCEAVPQPLLNA